MPWTVNNPPNCAKNWTDSEKAKCVNAANAVLQGGGSDEEAIYACIRAAGKSTKTLKDVLEESLFKNSDKDKK